MSPSSRKPVFLLATFAFLAVVTFLVTVGWSTTFMPPSTVVRELLRGPVEDGGPENTIVWSIRLARACGCALVGAILATVGSAFQALFRNPLAEPYVVGVSSGAAVGGVVAMTVGLGAALGGLMMPVFGFVGGMAALGLVFGLARRRGTVDVTTLLLAGVVVGNLLSALLSLILLAAGNDTNSVLRWLLGSTTPMFWNRVALLAIALVVGFAVLFVQARRLNAFAVGEEAAQRLGVHIGRLKATVLIAGTAMTAVAVGSVGIIGFLGLVAPHLARRLLGVDWRWSMVGSAVLGSVLLLASDLVAQRGIGLVGSLVTGTTYPELELPVGIVTALLGAPFLLVLLRKPEAA